MKGLTLLLVAGLVALICQPGHGAEEAAGHRRQGSRQSVLRSHQPRLPEVEQRERQLRIRMLLHRPGVDLGRGRRGADRAGHADQADDGGDCHLAVQRAADRADHPHGQPDHPGDDPRRRPRRGRCGAAQDLSRHRQLHDGLPDRRVHQGGDPRRRQDLHHRGQPGGGQYPAPRAGHARRAHRPEGPCGARR